MEDEKCCDCDCEEESIEDLAYESHHKIDALIDLLIAKGVFTEEEYEAQMEKLLSEMEEEEED